MAVRIENATGERFGGALGEDNRVNGTEPHDEHAVVRGVQRAVLEPLGEGQLPLEALRPRRPSRQTVRPRAPPGERIGPGVSINRWLRAGLL